MKNLLLILLLNMICLSCTQNLSSDNNPQKIRIKNELYLFLDTIENMFPANEIEGVKNYCLVLKKSNLNDVFFIFSYCTSNFPNEKEQVGYKGIIKVNGCNILVFDENDLGIKLYGASLQAEEIPNFKKHKSNFQMIICGYWKDNKLIEISTTEIIEKGWEQYFKFD
jgi:hypothetical protein